MAVCSHIREVEGSPGGGDDHQNVKNMVEEQFELNREILNDFRHGSHPGVFTGVMILQRIAGAFFLLETIMVKIKIMNCFWKINNY